MIQTDTPVINAFEAEPYRLKEPQAVWWGERSFRRKN